MKHSLAIVVCVALSAFASQPVANPLVRIEVSDVPVENGKFLTATFVELERQPDYSIIRTRIISGGSVSSAVFTLRGACAVLRARSERYVRSERTGDPGQFKLLFPKALAIEEIDGKAKNVVSREECELLGLDATRPNRPITSSPATSNKPEALPKEAKREIVGIWKLRDSNCSRAIEQLNERFFIVTRCRQPSNIDGSTGVPLIRIAETSYQNLSGVTYEIHADGHLLTKVGEDLFDRAAPLKSLWPE